MITVHGTIGGWSIFRPESAFSQSVHGCHCWLAQQCPRFCVAENTAGQASSGTHQSDHGSPHYGGQFPVNGYLS